MSFTHAGREIRKVAVIGSGQIGPDIALYFTKVLSPYGVQTVVVDVSDAALANGKAKLEKKISKGVESAAFTVEQQTQMLGAVSWTNDYQKLAGADLVVEAATENKELKGKIFAQVEALVGADAILVSNSSHLEPEVIFANTKKKDRTGVVHYFFPAERNLMVEVVPGAETSAATKAWLLSFYEAIGKVPIPVKSRYGYALDPVFEGLFFACALLAEAGVGTTKQIDTVCKKTFKMGIGSFTAMNLTGGNPITAVGLDNYTTKINAWFRTPQSLKDKVAAKANWEVAARGEVVEVPDALAARIRDDLLGAYFGICGEIVDAGLVTIADFNLGLDVALDMKPAFTYMNELGTKKSLELVQAYAKQHKGFPVPKCIEAHGKDNKPFEVPVVLREDRGGIAVLTIRRPKVLNALDQSVFEEIRTRFEQCDKRPEGQGHRADRLRQEGVRQRRRRELPRQDRQHRDGREDVAHLAGLRRRGAGGAEADGRRAQRPRVRRRHRDGDGVRSAHRDEGPEGARRPAGSQPRHHPGCRRHGAPAAPGRHREGRRDAAHLPPDRQREGEGLRPDPRGGRRRPGRARRAAVPGHGRRQGAAFAHGRGPMSNVPASLPAVDIGHLSKKVDEILCKAILGAAKLPLKDAIPFEAKCFGEVCGTEDMRIGVDNFMKNGPKVKAAFVHR